MDPAKQQEQFSNAYVRAVISAAGYRVYVPEPDDDSVDIGIGEKGACGTIRSPRIEIQLKSTSQDVLRDTLLSFRIEKKNYDELRGENFMVPRLLVVVVVPQNPTQWIKQSERALTMRHCGYWFSLRQCPPRTESSVTLYIPRAQVFTVSALKDLMAGIGRGDMP